MKNKILKYLHKRNLIENIINENELENILYKNNIVLYCGIDPTSDSLHIGHLILIKYINEFIKLGNKFIILIGGSTGLIGDPSFRNIKRNISNKYIINKNSKKITNQLKYILKNSLNNLIILNNKYWLNKINIINFLYKIGNKFYINDVLNKKFIKNKIKINNVSFSEIFYILLQSYDFLHLYNKYNAIIQIGGSDQWSNIIYGIKLIKKIYNKNVFGITFPILTDKNEIKYSKSLSNNIWLDKNKTNIYEFYQFWINIPDNMVFIYLKMLTNKSLNSIKKLEKNKNYKNIILSKKILANKLTIMIHGNKKLGDIIKITNKLFNKKYKFNENDFKIIINKIKTINIKLNTNIQEVLIKLNIVNSNSKAKEIILSNSIKIDKIIINDIKYTFNKNNILYNKYNLLCKSKKNYYLIICT